MNIKHFFQRKRWSTPDDIENALCVHGRDLAHVIETQIKRLMATLEEAATGQTKAIAGVKTAVGDVFTVLGGKIDAQTQLI